MIPYGRQDINQADIDAVVTVLRSDFLTQGPAIPLFEQTVSNFFMPHSYSVTTEFFSNIRTFYK